MNTVLLTMAATLTFLTAIHGQPKNAKTLNLKASCSADHICSADVPVAPVGDASAEQTWCTVIDDHGTQGGFTLEEDGEIVDRFSMFCLVYDEYDPIHDNDNRVIAWNGTLVQEMGNRRVNDEDGPYDVEIKQEFFQKSNPTATFEQLQIMNFGRVCYRTQYKARGSWQFERRHVPILQNSASRGLLHIKWYRGKGCDRR